MVLRTHADHTVSGAYVAGLAIPWGNYTNDPGGYHMVWCRDGGETALALAAAGHTDDAATALGYLAGRQRQDGSWPRCFFVSRVPAAFDPQAAVQLDEVAFPLLLAGKLDELGVPMPEGADNAITSAAGYLARNGPVSSQDVDRWEENAGASPFTIGLEIVAMLVAATRLTGPDRTLALALADNWNERLEEFTFVSGDEIDQAFGTDGHYVRIGLSGGGRVDLRNQPQDTQPVDAAALVGLEFGYLPRLGLRDPADKRVTDTLAIVEAMLGADTPSGRAYHRYDVDGYGEWLDGSGWPVRKFGIGRPWPLLAGERGHLDVLAGGDARTQLQAMLAMRGRGGLLPEQIWDANPLPWQNLSAGPAHRQRDAAGLGAQRADQARGGGRDGQAGRAAHPGQRPVPRGRARLADLVLAGREPGAGAARGADPGGGRPGPVHPALRVRRLGPGHDHRTGRAGPRPRPVRGHPHPGRSRRAGQPAVRTPLPGRPLGRRHPPRRRAGRSRAGHPAAVRRPPRPPAAAGG